MIRRRLIIVNIIILTLTLGLATFFETRALRSLLYRENTLQYNNMITAAQESLNNVLAGGEDKLLIVCANRPLQNLLNSGVPEQEALRRELNTLREIMAVENIEVYPVKGTDVYIWDQENEIYQVEENGLYDYKLDYSYQWHFRPDNLRVVRVVRAIYSLDNIEEIIGIASVDISLTDFTEIIYSFKGNGRDDYLCLLDEDNNYLLPSNKTGTMELQEYQTGELSIQEPSIVQNTLLVCNTFRQNDWKMVAVVSGSDMYADTRHFIRLTILAAVILEAIGIIFTFVITNRITEPIKQLSGEMHNIRIQKKFDHIDPPEGITSEIRELYDSYNQLIDQVNLSMSEAEEFSRKDAENEFRLLQAEINPHFLYNTLNTISWMATNNQDDDIQKVVIALVGLYRISLNNGKSTLPLRLEIEHVRNYLEIMSFRYPDRYEAEFNIDENTLELIVTKQILQPLAENALMHGFVESQEKGRIIISSRIEGDYLVLEVANTGTEVELEKVNRLLNNDPELSQKHYGIRNVNDRLMMYYGPDCHLEYSLVEGMTIVSMRLPMDKLKMEV
ncbi:MAG: sensor histidine kinase [Erysipelotrichaceae bacterium]|nr:sensor histidine kinase [Erysipelotrichaceae bacterium]